MSAVCDFPTDVAVCQQTLTLATCEGKQDWDTRERFGNGRRPSATRRLGIDGSYNDDNLGGLMTGLTAAIADWGKKPS